MWLYRSAKSWELIKKKKNTLNRAVFSSVSKVIGYCCGFVLQRSMLGRKHSRHNFSQSDAEQNQWRYFPALGALHVCDSSSHWFIVLFIFVVLGHYNCFGFTTQTVTVYSCRLPSLHARPSFSSLYPVRQAHAKLPSVLTQICAHLWPPDVLSHSSISVEINNIQ